MNIKSLRVGEMAANCYIIYENGKAIVVDPGDSADYIMNVLNDLDVKPSMIIATHCHFDHIMAATELKLAFNIPFGVNKKDEFLLKRMRETAKHFLGHDPGPAPKPDLYLKNGDTITKNLKVKIIETPGHTPGSVSLYLTASNAAGKLGALIVGDLIFADGTEGETHHEYSNKNDLDNSINKIFELPDDTIIYSGHGEATTVKKVKEARKLQ